MKEIFHSFSFRLFVLIILISRQLTYGQEPVTDTISSTPIDTSVKSAIKKILITDTITPKKSPFKGRFIGDGTFTRGNVNRTLIVLRAEGIYSGPAVNFAINPRFTYGKQNRILAERDSYIDLFVDIFKKKKTYLFGLGVLENSNLRRIDLREMIGAGVGFRLLRAENNELSITNAVLYESTNFKELTNVTTIRNSFRVKGKHSLLDDKIRFNHITFIQPALNDFSNWRWNTIMSVELPLTKRVILRTSFENSFESVVESTRKHNDSRITFGISIETDNFSDGK